MSGTIFISLSDPDFCKKWLNEEPLWNLNNFLSFYCILTLIVTFYVAFFVPERDPELEKMIPTVEPKAGEEVTVGMTF